MQPLTHLAALAFVVSSLAAGDAGLLPVNLVQPQWNQFSDSTGGQYWVEDSQGQIHFQNHSIISQAMGVTYDGQTLRLNAMMTADGAEYVWQGQSRNLQVARRLRLDGTKGSWRVIDIITNPGTKAEKFTLAITLRLNNNSSIILDESGSAAAAGPLAAKQGAILIPPPQGWNGARPGLVAACDPTSRVRPVIAPRGNMLALEYPLTVPPGRTVALLHFLSSTPGVETPAGAAPELKRIRHRAFLADLPPALRRCLVNWRGGGGLGGDGEAVTGIPAELAEARGDTDLLALGTATRLHGTATPAAGASVTVTTAHGTAQVPWSEVLALRGSREGGQPWLFLRSGEVLAGDTGDFAVRFLPQSGGEIVLGSDRIGWLLLRGESGGGEGQMTVSLRDGLRLAAVPGETRLRAATAWGLLDLPLIQIDQLKPDPEGRGHLLRLVDGSRLTVVLADEQVTMRSVRFGERTFSLSQLESVSAPAAKDEAASEPTVPSLTLAGGAVVMGTIDLPELRLRVEGAVVPVPPAQARRLTPREVENGGAALSVDIELWGGDVVAGVLEDPLLPVRTAVGRLLVPPRDLQEAVVPTPSLSPQARAKVSDLVADLGHTEWSRREAASKALTEMGDACVPMLEEARRGATDPEVVRRLERLLEGK